MSIPQAKRFILPFAPQSNREPFNVEVEEAAVYASAELERSKGGGLILKQPKEKLAFLAKIGYPLWLFPKFDAAYIFDGLKNTSYTMTYFELPSAQTFLDSLGKVNTREDFMVFLSDHSNYFVQPKKKRQFSVSDLIVDSNFKKELAAYRREATEVTGQNVNALLQPSLEEATISTRLTEIGGLQSDAKAEAERLPECLRLLNKTTSQYVTELNYAAEAIKDEANAKVKAQEEFINPKVSALSSEYKRRIAEVARNFDSELEKLQKTKTKNEKSIESSEAKIRLYEREAEAQASQKHSIYEKRWKEKSSQTKKDLDSLKKEVKRAEKSMRDLSQEKKSQIFKLQVDLETEIKRLRQPVLDLAEARDDKIQFFKRQTENLFKLEKTIIDSLAGTIKLAEANSSEFSALGTVDSQLKTPTLFYVPFYVACYETPQNRRFMFLPPAMASPENFASKLRVLGRSKIRQLVIPRFQAISALIENVKTLANGDAAISGQIRDLGERSNVLSNPLARSKIADGLLRLRNEGWLSDKEYQAANDGLT